MANPIVQQHEVMKHPAWEAAERLLSDSARWAGFWAGAAHGYFSWQIALAMAVAGFGDDVIVEAYTDCTPTVYVFPDYEIPVDASG